MKVYMKVIFFRLFLTWCGCHGRAAQESRSGPMRLRGLGEDSEQTYHARDPPKVPYAFQKIENDSCFTHVESAYCFNQFTSKLYLNVLLPHCHFGVPPFLDVFRWFFRCDCYDKLCSRPIEDPEAPTNS